MWKQSIGVLGSVMGITVSAQGALIATDNFLVNAADTTTANPAAGEYVASGAANQLRRGTTTGNGQNPTVAGFNGAWAGNVTNGSLAVAQWTAEPTGVIAPGAVVAGGRIRFGGAAATNALQRRVNRDLSAYTPSNTYFISIATQATTGDQDNLGVVGVGFTGPGTDTTFASGSTMRGLLIGVAGNGTGTDFVVRHVGSTGAVQNDVIASNIVQGDLVTLVYSHFTVVRVDFNDDPTNPQGNSKLTVWQDPTALTSEADATTAAAPLVFRTFGLTTNADMTQLTATGINWTRPSSFDAPALGTTWESVVTVVVPEPSIAGFAAAGVAVLMPRRRR